MGVFHFKRFDVDDRGCGMKICSDSVLLAAWFLPPYADRLSVADIGAGSGVLSLLAADIMPRARIYAVEIDPPAAAAAAANFAASPWSGRLTIINQDFVDFVHEPRSYDIVISNPPYFATGHCSSDGARAQARHAGSLNCSSLLGTRLLAPDGHLGLVAPAELEDEIIFAATLAGLHLHRLCRVVTACGKAPSRLLADFSPLGAGETIETLHIRLPDGSYTPRYRSLVENYYAKI